MTTAQLALWWAVLLSCHASHAPAADRQSIDSPYKKLIFRNNTAAATEILSSSQPSVFASISSAPPVSRTAQGVLPLDVASHSSFPIAGTLSVERPGIATPTNDRDGELPAAGARDSDASAFGNAFIANLTTFTRPPLTAPSILAGQANLTNIAFPTFSLNTTNNVTTTTTATTTTGRYTNSSTTTPVANTIKRPITLTDPQDFCTPTSSYGSFVTVIEYSIIHTWTITWPGNPTDYTPPFPTIGTPTPCPPAASATGGLTITVCDSSGQTCSLVQTTLSLVAGPLDRTDPWRGWGSDTSIIRGMEPTITFVTTDKNPAVVFPTSLPPDYGGTPDPMGNVHSAAHPNTVESPDAPDYGDGVTTNQNIKSRPLTDLPVTVIVKPSFVVIGDQTFTNDPARPTSTVVVGGNTFTINPTQVVGLGATVTRPPGIGTMVTTAATPSHTKTTISHIEVDVEGTDVVIDKTTFTIGPRPTTAVVKGQTITVGPGAIVFPSQTLAIPAPPDTTRVVFGAELITAIGSDRVVIEGRTITYGPGSSSVTEVIDGDTVLIGPSGIVAGGETYGGIHAASTDTRLAVVGGVTISQVGPTVVVVEGVTYTLNPFPAATGQRTDAADTATATTTRAAATTTTTVLGGETITIGPGGVTIETWTLGPPYASTTVITPNNGDAGAQPTTNANNDENDGCSSASRCPRWVLSACIAMGASVIAAQLF